MIKMLWNNPLLHINSDRTARRAAREEYFRITNPAWSDFQNGKISHTEYKRIEREALKKLQQVERQSRSNPLTSDVRVGDVYDQFGQKWTVTRVNRKKREVSVEGDQGRDMFGKPHAPRRDRMSFRDLESLKKVSP